MKPNRKTLLAVAVTMLGLFAAPARGGGDLDDIKAAGVLRHLGIPYAHFVTGAGDGMDVDLVRMFASEIGVRYEYVKTDWGQVFGDLTGTSVRANGDDVTVLGSVPIKGDIAANGITVLPWREKVIAFGERTFQTQVWIVARADSTLRPIRPSGSLQADISSGKQLLKGRLLQGKANTCLDPALYDIDQTGARVKLFPGSLNELAPALINGEAELTLLDVPDSLVALAKYPGRIKILGPITDVQDMAPAFRKDAPKLRAAFNRFLEKCRTDGTLEKLARKYYPVVFDYFPDMFGSAKAR